MSAPFSQAPSEVFRIITAAERMAEPRGIKGCIFGRSGVGKTSLLWTLPDRTTLSVDLEAGDLAVEGWPGDTIRPRTWPECRDFAALLGGPNPALRSDQPYSAAHHAAVRERFDGSVALDRYETAFVDSITVAGRLCLQWCRGQPEALAERNGRPDTRGAYGLHGREMIAWLTQLQHTRGKNIILVGILDEKLDDFGRKVFAPQIDGSKTGLELPGIVDEVLTLAAIKDEAGQLRRALVCQTLNLWGYPAKDRSGRLDLIEEPHLGRLFEKIRGPARPIAERLSLPTTLPTPIASTTAPTA